MASCLIQEDVRDGCRCYRLNMVGGRGDGVLDEQAAIERMPQRPERDGQRQEPRHDDGELDGCLSAIGFKRSYKPFIPWAMASHSSWSFGRNSAMAMIAITTRTPTRMAYSVVPWPAFECASSCIRVVVLAAILVVALDSFAEIVMTWFLSSYRPAHRALLPIGCVQG